VDASVNIKDSNILIVDDNPSNLAMLFNYLTRRGYKVLVADSGKTALSMANEVEPDLILLDVIMPEMDGYTVCTEIKNNERIKDVPVIFLSAVSSAEDKIRAFNSGGVDYITKPFNYEELAARVSAQLTIKHQKAKLLQLNNDLEVINTRKDRLFSIISHDIRSPLSTILGYSEIIIEDFNDLSPDEIKEYNHYIHNVAKEINGLMSNLLDWSRIQLDRIDYLPEEMKLSKVIEKIKNLFKQAAELKGITLTADTSQADLISADINMLNTILRNLVSNAIKFTNHGGAVSITSFIDKGRVYISVADTGIGISTQEIKNLFKLVNQQPKTGTNNEKGTGLGLILCKEFIEKHGGTLTVESELKQGSTFTFDLCDNI